MNRLTNEQLEVFDKLECCITEYISLNEEAIFSYAYRLGMRTAMEVIQENFNLE